MVGVHSSWDGDEGTRHGVHWEGIRLFLEEFGCGGGGERDVIDLVTPTRGTQRVEKTVDVVFDLRDSPKPRGGRGGAAKRQKKSK